MKIKNTALFKSNDLQNISKYSDCFLKSDWFPQKKEKSVS